MRRAAARIALRPTRKCATAPLAAGCCAIVLAGEAQRRKRPIACSWFTSDHDKRRAALDWQLERSVRSRAFLHDDAILQKIAVVINELVDLDSWTEEQEQELFESSVSKVIEEVASALPPPFFDMLHNDHGCLEKETAADLTANLIKMCVSRLDFPFLDEQDKRRIIRAVVWVLIESMSNGNTIYSMSAQLGEAEMSEKLCIEVFIEGAMDVFFDPEMRKNFVKDITGDLPEMPFIPPSLIEKVVCMLIKAFSEILRDALKETYMTLKRAVQSGEKLPAAEPQWGLSDEQIAALEETYKDQPFLCQLRRVVIRKIIVHEEDSYSTFKQMSQKWQYFFVSLVVDAVCIVIPGLGKIEQTVQPFKEILSGEKQDEGEKEVELKKLTFKQSCQQRLRRELVQWRQRIPHGVPRLTALREEDDLSGLECTEDDIRPLDEWCSFDPCAVVLKEDSDNDQRSPRSRMESARGLWDDYVFDLCTTKRRLTAQECSSLNEFKRQLSDALDDKPMILTPRSGAMTAAPTSCPTPSPHNTEDVRCLQHEVLHLRQELAEIRAEWDKHRLEQLKAASSSSLPDFQPLSIPDVSEAALSVSERSQQQARDLVQDMVSAQAQVAAFHRWQQDVADPAPTRRQKTTLQVVDTRLHGA